MGCDGISPSQHQVWDTVPGSDPHPHLLQGVPAREGRGPAELSWGVGLGRLAAGQGLCSPTPSGTLVGLPRPLLLLHPQGTCWVGRVLPLSALRHASGTEGVLARDLCRVPIPHAVCERGGLRRPTQGSHGDGARTSCSFPTTDLVAAGAAGTAQRCVCGASRPHSGQGLQPHREAPTARGPLAPVLGPVLRSACGAQGAGVSVHAYPQ